MKIIVSLVIFLLIGSSLQMGTLYLDQISANTDPITGVSMLKIEGVEIDDSTLTLDFINGRESPGTGPGYGVNVEGSIQNEGNWFIPQHLVIEGDYTNAGLLRPNGGIICDDGNPDDDDTHSFEYSWRLFDDSGDIHILGSLTPNGGLNMNNLFFVEDNTGRTFISGLTRPDGGLVSDDTFSADGNSGELYSEGNMSVEQDIYLGTAHSETRMVTRLHTNSASGGVTFINGQSAGTWGGQLVFVPGLAVGDNDHQYNGKAILGPVNLPTALSLLRYDVDDDDGTKDAGATIYSGQDAGLNGGDVMVRAGNSVSAGDGGDIILAVSPTTGSGSSSGQGSITLGSYSYSGDYGNRNGFNYLVTRPTLIESEDGADTTFRAQNGNSGASGITLGNGDFVFRAGSSFSGILNKQHPGDVIVSGGMDAHSTGTIYIGKSAGSGFNSVLNVERYPTAANGGRTFFTGQHAETDGGDVFFQAGYPGGDLMLLTGARSGAGGSRPGIITWGYGINELWVGQMTTNTELGNPTSILGQAGTTSGGSFNILSGQGELWGGDLFFEGGVGETRAGGAVTINAGLSVSSGGGEVHINAGNGASGTSGGYISLWAGSAGWFLGTPGNVNFVAGQGLNGGSNNGLVIVNSNGNPSNFNLQSIPFVFNALDVTRRFQIQSTTFANTVTLGANPNTHFIGSSSDNSNMLTDPASILIQYAPSPFNFDEYPGNEAGLVFDYTHVAAAAEQTRVFFNQLVAALVSAHDLINTVGCGFSNCCDPQWGSTCP